MDNPDFLSAIYCNKFVHIQAFGGQVGALFRQLVNDVVFVEVVSVSAYDFKRFINNTYDQFASLHIGYGRHIRNDILRLLSGKTVFQILELFPFARGVFGGIVVLDVLLDL